MEGSETSFWSHCGPSSRRKRGFFRTGDTVRAYWFVSRGSLPLVVVHAVIVNHCILFFQFRLFDLAFRLLVGTIWPWQLME